MKKKTTTKKTPHRGPCHPQPLRIFLWTTLHAPNPIERRLGLKKVFLNKQHYHHPV
jgi:hypothetical protein